MKTCAGCGAATPAGHFCVRCGAPLDPGWRGGSRMRGHYAAAPHEHVALPALISTLFPHLPRGTHWAFRVAALLGCVVIAALAVARLFPVALLASALLVPALVVLYLVEVNLYEDEPVWAVSLTLGWGAVVGVVWGVVALGLTPSAASVALYGSGQYNVGNQILLPLAGLLVLLGGPLVLLRYHRFNEVLDGVTFAAASAAAYSSGYVIAFSVHYLGSGLRPTGAVLPWIWRLFSLGVATPVLTIGAAAAACAALWLRYRAPARDAEALGPAGHPAVALPLAAGLVAAGAAGETFLPAGAWLAWLVALDLVVMVLLRRAIHVGLLEEALEVPIGPPIVCPNCGEQTAQHTFCGSCGISLQALPKHHHRDRARRAPAAGPIPPPAEAGA